MTFYGEDFDEFEEWLELRKGQLLDSFGGAIYAVTGSLTWPLECIVRLNDAADRQARVERLAHLCGEPVPEDFATLAELLKWVLGDAPRHGDDDYSLPPLTVIDRRDEDLPC